MEDMTSSYLYQQKGTEQQARNFAEDSIHMRSSCVDVPQAQSSAPTGATTPAHRRPSSLAAPEGRCSSAGPVQQGHLVPLTDLRARDDGLLICRT